ncbi:MAG: hypothetical protein IPO01_09570 [Chitinophagaceae bacterium]|nr:hypothetical protein [Chitinophagaceae bacterium]MBL0200025.1 hypothetical protein [Chitinophagaceae bacterium]
MKYLNLTKSLAVVAMLSLAFSACKKAKVATPMGDAGQTLVKLLGGGTPAAVASRPIDFVATPTTVVAVEVRRDIPNETELNKTMIVTVKDDTAAVTAAGGRLHLPAAWYTYAVAGGTKTGGQGGVFTITFQPGEFSKTIFVTVPNATLLNPSSLYGLGFTVLTADQGATLSTQKSVIVEIGAKNPYDGIYSVESGWVTRYTSPGVPAGDAISGDCTGNPDVYMLTTGAYRCNIPPVSTTGGLYWANAAVNNSMVAGIDGTSATVDPSTNLVTMACTGNATLTNWAGKTNNYVPSTKTFNLAFRWNPTGAVREYELVLKYKGPR